MTKTELRAKGLVAVEWVEGPHDGDTQAIPEHVVLPSLRTCRCHGATYIAHQHEGAWRLEFMHHKRSE